MIMKILKIGKSVIATIRGLVQLYTGKIFTWVQEKRCDNNFLLSSILVKLILLSVIVIIFRYSGDRSFLQNYSTNSVIHSAEESLAKESKDQTIVADYLKVKILQEHTMRVSDLDFSSLGNSKKSREKKMVGWLQIPGIVVNYPIMYSKDNNYYLKHSSTGKDSETGAVFMDSSSNGFWHQINVVHGHNMMSGAMFGELSKYKNAAWGKKHRYLYVTEDDGMIYRFKVFSAYTMDGNKETLKVSCATQSEYETYLKQLQARSIYKLEAAPVNSQIILLNTCSYSYKGEHFIVCAYTDDASNVGEELE